MSEENQTEEIKKAYDHKLLLANLKDQGLEIAEESAKILVNGVMDWLEESAELSDTPYDDMASMLYPQLRKMALDKAEDINKADNA
tara:strand:+ start:27671 stop:27928 length:258 start_codon:yes stop_codon:yes gene_type:complete